MNSNLKNIKFNSIFLFIIFLFFILFHYFEFNLIYGGKTYSVEKTSISPEQYNEIKPFKNKIDFLLKEKKIIEQELLELRVNINNLKTKKQKILTNSGKCFKFKNSNEVKIFHLIEKKHFLQKRLNNIELELKKLKEDIKKNLKSNDEFFKKKFI
ncbi:hypothetical protein [Candidatus Phytoplasma sacchari]|nr:hypothetical protein [Candidatus Phytoplasma sacchari]KAB8122678.1 hypothetical protein F2B49_01190 [Candidatus Phytoplasma sacchari]